MRLAFINPALNNYRKIMRNFDCATESKANYLYQPYDFLLMSAKVPENWTFQLFDGIAEQSNCSEFLEQISKFNPDMIVLSMANTSWSDDLFFLQKLKELSTAKIFVFGDAFFEPEYRNKVQGLVNGIFEDPIFIDFEELKKGKPLKTFDQEGQQSLKSPKNIKLGRPRHKDFLHPMYRWPFARHSQYTTVFTAWGCPYSCSYCIMAQFPNYWREAEEILEELSYIKSLGIKEVYIGDRSFGLPQKNIYFLLDQMIERDLKFSWSTYFHPNQYSPELLEKMKKSGCHTIISGIESHDFEDLKNYGRYLKENKLYEMIGHANELGIDICGDFIIGLPNQSKGSILKTIELAKNMNIQFASFNIAAPLPGTSIRREAIKDGRIHDQNLDYFDSLGKKNALSNGALKGEEIQRLKNYAVRSFYLRPHIFWQRLKKVESVEHFKIQALEGLKIFF